MSSRIVLFDLDGTLVDTAPDLVAALNSLLARRGLPAVAQERVRNMIGGGARRLIERALAEERVHLRPDEIETLYAEYIRYYSAHIAEHSRPFPGVEDALAELARAGVILAVCTNKLERLSSRLLEHLGLLDRFAAVCGPDTFAVHKPNPEILRATVARAGGTLAQAVMVGDSATDIDMARAAGVPVIAVDFGYTEVPVYELSPDRVISRFADLPRAVFELLQTPQKMARARP